MLNSIVSTAPERKRLFPMLTKHYISIPKQLIQDTHDNPLALAIYFLIGRLYLIHQTAIPLSRGDIQKIDPTAREGAIKRALHRLKQEGWVYQVAGHKGKYIPSWGKKRTGELYLWKIGKGVSCLGCPWDIWRDAMRIDQALLDRFLGKFTPHLRNAHFESYFTKPLLSLQQIANYIRISAGYHDTDTDELQRWGLICNGQAQPIPDINIILALASLRASIATFQLTEAGWRKLGCFQQQSTIATSTTATLFFAPLERIGDLIPPSIGHPIGCATQSDSLERASECHQTQHLGSTSAMTWIPKESNNSKDSSPYPLKSSRGGSITCHNNEKTNARTTRPETETAQVLRAFGVNDPKSIKKLESMPIKQVKRAIAYAQAESLGAGWVVRTLERYRDEGIAIPSAHPRWQRNEDINIDSVMSGVYRDIFRRGGDTADLEKFELSGSQEGVYNLPSTASVDGGSVAQQLSDNPLIDNWVNRPNGSIQMPHSQPINELSLELRRNLRSRCDRRYHQAINGLVVRGNGALTTVQCASVNDRQVVVDVLMGAVRYAAAELGLPSAIHITDG